MSPVRRARRWLAALCILAVLLCAALAPVCGGTAPSVLVPLAPLFGLVVIADVWSDAATPIYASFDPGPCPSRAPPLA